jgi:hypothetical protein
MGEAQEHFLVQDTDFRFHPTRQAKSFYRAMLLDKRVET